jgi:hypothetical protein
MGGQILYAGFNTKMAVFWVVAPCSLVEVHHQGDPPDDGASKYL